MAPKVLKRPAAKALQRDNEGELRKTAVTVSLLSGEQLAFADLPRKAFVHHLRCCLEKTRPTPPGSCYRLMLGDLLLSNNMLLPEEPSALITAAVQQGICGSWTRSFLAKDHKFERPPVYMAYSLALDCLILGNENGDTIAVDLTTLSLCDVEGLDKLETPFPGLGMAIGALVISSGDKLDTKRARLETDLVYVETVFVSEQRYDHVKVSEVRAARSATSARPSATFEYRPSIGGEGKKHMTAPSFLCLDPDADELWVVRDEGGDQEARFICVVQASTGKKLGVILDSAISIDNPWWSFCGLALSDHEAFVAHGQTVKVFDRAERVKVQVPTNYVGKEAGIGYAFRRELKLAECPKHLLWLDDQLIACCPHAIYFLDQDGKELNRIATTGERQFSACCAAVCGCSGGRPMELAVLDSEGNVHFYA